MSKVQNSNEEELELETSRELLLKSIRHDVKNLVNLAEGYYDLAETVEDPIETDNALKQAQQAETRIDNIYNKLELHQDNTSATFQEIIGESLETLRPKIQKEEKNISINWRSSNYECENCIMTERMIYNLLDNSLDHGNGDIELEIEQLNDYVQLELSDGGALSDEEFDEIFCHEYEEDEYISTGSYLIDTIAHNIDAEITPSDTADYNIKIPLKDLK